MRKQLHCHLPEQLVVRETRKKVVERHGRIRPGPFTGYLCPGGHEGQDRIYGQVFCPARTHEGRAAHACDTKRFGQFGRSESLYYFPESRRQTLL